MHIICIFTAKKFGYAIWFLKSKVQIYIRHTYSYVGYAFILHVKLCIHIFSHLHACQVLSRAGRYCNFSGRYIVSKKTRDITIYRGFYISLGIDCSIRVFRSLSLIWFCKYWTRLLSSVVHVAITSLLASKRVSRQKSARQRRTSN